MKTIKLLWPILPVLLLFSCAQDLTPESQRLNELKNLYDSVGMEHNLKLDELLSVYQCAENNVSYESCISMANAYFGRDIPNENAAGVIRLLEKEGTFAKAASNSDVMEILKDSMAVFADYPEVFDSLCVVLDGPGTVGEKQIKLETVYLFANETIGNENDKEAVMNGISTVIHSLGYWDENLPEWQSLLGESFPKPLFGIAGAIGIIDGAGAVIGTLEGIRDTYKGQEGRGRIILGRTIGEAAKTSAYAVLAIIMI